MSQRVLATPEATEQVGVMRRVVDGGLAEQLGVLNGAAGRLSSPDVWDGPHAVQFRALWHEIQPKLEATRQDLAELQARIDTITGQILLAGGV